MVGVIVKAKNSPKVEYMLDGTDNDNSNLSTPKTKKLKRSKYI